MQANGNWQLDRRISVGHVVTTLTFLVAMLMWGARLETRIALMEENDNRQEILDARQDTDMQRTRQEIKAELERLNIKLDRYFEAQLHRAGRSGRAQAE